jgi:DNA-directed RNA polymerase specialized sigma24 family protein
VKAIAVFPSTLRTTANLVILNEQALQDVGRILEASADTVKSRLFRSRRASKPMAA